MGSRTGAVLFRRAPAPCVCRPARDRAGVRYPAARVFGFAHGVSAGPDRDPLSALRRLAGILPVFGESRRSPGAVPVRLSRCRAAEALGLHLHCVATGELLAGCCERPQQRPDLSSAGGLFPVRRYRTGHRTAACDTAVSRHDEIRSRACERIVPARPATGEDGQPEAGAGYRSVQPGRVGDFGCRRAARVRCAELAAGHLHPTQVLAGCARDPGKSAVSQHPLQLRAAYGVCRHIARSAAKNFYYGFLALPQRKRNALSAVYAFMRRCDDIADDNTLSSDDRHNKLAEWLDKAHRAMAAMPTDDPVLLALTDA